MVDLQTFQCLTEDKMHLVKVRQMSSGSVSVSIWNNRGNPVQPEWVCTDFKHLPSQVAHPANFVEEILNDTSNSPAA